MAPYPEEIDVFSTPHSRMKQLVDVYSEKVQNIFVLHLCHNLNTKLFPLSSQFHIFFKKSYLFETLYSSFELKNENCK